MAFTYIVEVDWGRDGTFGHASANISDYVESFTCRHGMSAPGQHFATPATATIVLRDEASDFLVGQFLAGTFSQLLKRGLLVRIRVTDGVTTWTLWTGKIDEVLYPSANRAATPREGIGVTLICRDPMLELLDAEYFPTLMTNVTTDEPLTALFDSGVVQYPYPAFTLDVSVLDGSDDLFIADFIDFDTGVTTLAFVGDNADAGRGVSAQQYARDAVEAEVGGRFWWDAPTGEFKFINRLNDPFAPTTAIIPFTNLAEAPIAYAPDMATVVNVTYNPRAIGADYSNVYTHQALPYKVEAGGVRTITARYMTTEGAKIGVTSIVPPLAGQDYAAVFFDDGTTLSRGEAAGASAIDATSDVSVFVEVGASSAILTLVNRRQAREVYFTNLQLRGTPLATFSASTVTANDPQAIYNYGRIERTYALRLLDDDDFALQAATHLVGKASDPEPRLTGATFIATDALKAYLGYGVGARLTFQQLTPVARYHDSDYIVLGIAHQVDARAREHRVTWTLDRHRRQTYFLLDTSKLAPSGAYYETILAF